MLAHTDSGLTRFAICATAPSRTAAARSNCSRPPATVRLKQSQWRTAFRLLRLKLIFLLAA
jgi:hypothetical protein